MILTTPLFSQTSYYNFEINNDEGTAIYKKVFEMDNINKEGIINYIKSLSHITFTKTDEELDGKIKGMIINYKKYGVKKGSMPIFINGEFSANLRVQFKDDKYRITLKNMKFANRTNTYENDYNFSVNAVNRRKGVLKVSSKIFLTGKAMIYMDKHFNDIFTYKDDNSDDDW